MKKKTESRTQWHAAFREAIRLTLSENDDDLRYDKEYILSKGDLKTDLLVIRKRDDVRMKNLIGRIFRKYNLFEYKSPGDGLNIDTFYKVMAYGCLYKSQYGHHVDEIRADEITLTMIREAKPLKMFDVLKTYGVHVKRAHRGIYYLTGRVLFPTQVVVTGELSEKENLWLKVLTKNLNQDNARKIVLDMDSMSRDSWKRQSADSVMQVSVSVNHEVFEDLKKEEPYMCDALRELMAPEIKEAVDAAVDTEVRKTRIDMYSTEMHFTPDQISVKMDLPEDKVKEILADIAKDKKKSKK